MERPLSPGERAEKIIDIIGEFVLIAPDEAEHWKIMTNRVASQITEVYQEAYEDGMKHPDIETWKIAVAEGFRAAREKAARIAQRESENSDDCRCHKLIRALEPDSHD